MVKMSGMLEFQGGKNVREIKGLNYSWGKSDLKKLLLGTKSYLRPNFTLDLNVIKSRVEHCFTLAC